MQVMGSLMATIPLSIFFFFFAFITFAGNCVVYFIPETSRQSYAEIEEKFQSLWNKLFPPKEDARPPTPPESGIHPSSNGNEADLDMRMADLESNDPLERNTPANVGVNNMCVVLSHVSEEDEMALSGALTSEQTASESNVGNTNSESSNNDQSLDSSNDEGWEPDGSIH